MIQDPARSATIASVFDVTPLAERLLHRISSELLELPADVSIDSDLFDAGLDSMAIMQVILMVEDEFGATLPDAAIKRETFATARRIAEAVAKLKTVS